MEIQLLIFFRKKIASLTRDFCALGSTMVTLVPWISSLSAVGFVLFPRDPHIRRGLILCVLMPGGGRRQG